MVKRLIVQGLSRKTTEKTLREHFEKFGELYECVVPPPPRYSAKDTGPDDEPVEARSSIQYESVGAEEVLDDELVVEQYDEQKHGDFEKYMRMVGEGELFTRLPKNTCAGYAYITFIDSNGFSNCMSRDVHEIDQMKCTVELAREPVDYNLKIESKRLFVSYFPLERLTSKELKNSFGAYGKITDVEFVNDSEGPLHFCIITFQDSKSVDVCIQKSFYIRDVRLFTRRAILKESIKMAEHRRREEEKQVKIQLPPNHTAYPNRQRHQQYQQLPPQLHQHHQIPVDVSKPPPTVQQPPVPNYLYDPSAAAGYAPLLPRVVLPKPPESDPASNYGYGPRKW